MPLSSTAMPGLTPADWIAHWARVCPVRVAMREVSGARAVSYAELDAMAWRWVGALLASGARSGDRVALLARNGVVTFEVLAACLRLGLVFTPLNWRLSGPELVDICAECAPRVLIYDEGSPDATTLLLHRLPEIRGIALRQPLRASDNTASALMTGAADHGVVAAADPEAPSMLLYTSGTSGRPKGVLLPHRQVFWNALNTVAATDLGPDDRVLGCLPLFHTGGLNCLATPTLYRGGTLLLMDSFEPAAALRALESHRGTQMVAVPTMYQMLLDAGLDAFDLSSLTTLLCGGAPCPPPLLAAFLDRGFNFRQGFGMTEVGPNCFSLPAKMARRKPGSVGQPVMHVEACVVDEDGRHLGVGQTGELRLSGPIVCSGYFGDDATTAGCEDEPWFSTGDLARFDDEGYFYIDGRKKEMFISGGENVYPAEVEAVIAAVPGVVEVAVLGIADERWQEVGLAFVVVSEPFDVETLRAACVARLARFKVPKRFERIDELPKNATGKVDRARLRARIDE